jgi:hypothetical protein
LNRPLDGHIEKEDTMDLEMEKTVAIAKSAPETKTKAQWYSELRKFSNRSRQHGESAEQAFAKFIVDPDGRDMFAAYNKAKGPSWSSPAQSESDISQRPNHNAGSGDDDRSPGYETLRQIATTIREKHPELSVAKSVELAIQTPAGAAAYLADKRARRIA